MKSKILMSLLAMALTATSCGNGHDKQEKAPTRVKTEVVKSTNDGTSKPYVGIVEEREGTAVSFTSALQARTFVRVFGHLFIVCIFC